MNDEWSAVGLQVMAALLSVALVVALVHIPGISNALNRIADALEKRNKKGQP